MIKISTIEDDIFMSNLTPINYYLTQYYIKRKKNIKILIGLLLLCYLTFD